MSEQTQERDRERERDLIESAAALHAQDYTFTAWALARRSIRDAERLEALEKRVEGGQGSAEVSDRESVGDADGPVPPLRDDETCPECEHEGRFHYRSPKWAEVDGCTMLHPAFSVSATCGCKRLRAPTAPQGSTTAAEADDAARDTATESRADVDSSGPVGSAPVEHPKELWLEFDETDRRAVRDGDETAFEPAVYLTERMCRANAFFLSGRTRDCYVLKSVADAELQKEYEAFRREFDQVSAISEILLSAGELPDGKRVVECVRDVVARMGRAEARVRQLEGDLAAERDAFGRMDVEKQNATAEIVALTAEVASLRSRLEEAEKRAVSDDAIYYGRTLRWWRDGHSDFQKHRDRWRRFALKGGERPTDYLPDDDAPAPTSAPREETAWLIERGEAFGQRPTCWWGGEGCEWGQWTPNANRAIRFTSREAAEEAIRNRSRPVGDPFGTATEHVFLAALRPPAPVDTENAEADRVRPVGEEQEPVALTFNDLREANRRRIPQFKNRHGQPAYSEPDGSDWTPAQWLQAVTGELGEYANLRKKFERGDLTAEEFNREAADELADVQTYLDILAFRLGIDLGAATASKFNRVSERVGADVRLPLYAAPPSTPPAKLGEAREALLAALTRPAPLPAMSALDELCKREDGMGDTARKLRDYGAGSWRCDPFLQHDYANLRRYLASVAP